MTRNRIWLAGVLLLAGVGVALAADRSSLVNAPDRNEPIFSATQIINYPTNDASIARFDSRTGAIHGLQGNVANPSSRVQWELRVPPVSEPHSGKLEIQQITAGLNVRPQPRPSIAGPRGGRLAPRPTATFLVDVISGDTWILRLRANENGTWDRVGVFR